MLIERTSSAGISGITAASADTLHGLFRSQALKTPDAVALIEGDRRLTYAELEARANRIAHLLIATGAHPGDIVATALPRRFDFVATLLAVAKAGCAYMPLDPDLPSERLRFLLDAAATRLIVTDTATASRLPAGPVPLMLDQAGEALEESPDSPPTLLVSPQAVAYVTFTSGSTGTPKGSLVPHCAIPGFFRANPHVVAGPGEIWLQHSSILWDAMTLELWPALLSGGTVVLMPELRPNLGALADALVDHQITALWLGASLFNALVDDAADALASVRTCLVGGEALSIPHIRRAQQALPQMVIVNGYGPSECTVFATCHPLPAPLPEALRSVPIGRPVGDRQVYLLDATMQRVPVGVPGELCVGGPAVAHGYLGRAKLTATAFVPDPFGPPGTRLYRTGDFARWQDGGTLEFIGRRDSQVKLRGFRIETGEIESRIKACPGVRDAAVTLRDGEKLVAYVVPERADTGGVESQVAGWERVFDERVYTAPSTAADPRFNTTGWQSSLTGEDIPPHEMRAWAADIVDMVRDLKPAHVLEIGCGSGMLLLQLAPDAASYTGTDISAAAIDYVRGQAGNPANLRLLQQPAHDWSGIAPHSVDVVLLSSVVQYFPNVDYLVTVLEGCHRALRPGGSIVLADLRSLPLAACFAAALAQAHSPSEQPVADLRARMEHRLLHESELLLDPALFTSLGAVLPGLDDVRIRVERGRAVNELTQYRYHVVMTSRSRGPGPEPMHLSSPALDDIAAALSQGPARLLATELPNARLSVPAAALAHIAGGFPPAGPGVEPEDLQDLAARLGYVVEVGWSDRDPFRIDASFARAGIPAPLPVARSRSARGSWQSYANQPHQAALPDQLLPGLRQTLSAVLPDYMVPAAFVLLDRIPLTANGKLDRRALPAPADERAMLGKARVSPRTALETVLAGLYKDLLHVDGIGVHDGFFDLGGHSLLVTQLASRIRNTFKIDLPLRTLFERPSVAALAEAIAEADPKPGQAERIAAITLSVAAMTPAEVAAMRAKMGN